MRTIKFRAWEKDEKYMSKPFSFSDIEPNGEIEEGTISLEECAVMQFTGLLDKNGKEIYEGNIVQMHHPKEHRKNEITGLGTVVFHKGQYIVEDTMDDDSPLYGKWEVIGNIYENPELLSNPNN